MQTSIANNVIHTNVDVGDAIEALASAAKENAIAIQKIADSVKNIGPVNGIYIEGDTIQKCEPRREDEDEYE